VSSLLSCPGSVRALHSFPTRRSSDLDDALVLGFLNALPPDKRQPNLLFAAARYLLNSPPTLDLLHTFVMQMPSVLTDVMTSRRRSEEHTSELQSRFDLVCRLLLEKEK